MDDIHTCKSFACKGVLMLMDEGDDYLKALKKTLALYDVSREELEFELDIYI